jgi:hypothetical protein
VLVVRLGCGEIAFVLKLPGNDTYRRDQCGGLRALNFSQNLNLLSTGCYRQRSGESENSET